MNKIQIPQQEYIAQCNWWLICMWRRWIWRSRGRGLVIRIRWSWISSRFYCWAVLPVMQTGNCLKLGRWGKIRYIRFVRKAQLRQYLASTNGLIDGKALKEVLFPKGKYHIFLSHSHGDLQIAQYLKAWLNINCGLKCFIDADVWENAYDLIKELDNKYSKNTTGSYDYDRCTQTTAMCILCFQWRYLRLLMK